MRPAPDVQPVRSAPGEPPTCEMCRRAPAAQELTIPHGSHRRQKVRCCIVCTAALREALNRSAA